MVCGLLERHRSFQTSDRFIGHGLPELSIQPMRRSEPSNSDVYGVLFDGFCAFAVCNPVAKTSKELELMPSHSTGSNVIGTSMVLRGVALRRVVQHFYASHGKSTIPTSGRSISKSTTPTTACSTTVRLLETTYIFSYKVQNGSPRDYRRAPPGRPRCPV